MATIERPANPPAVAVRFAEAPTVDGDLSEAAWKQAKSLGPFFLLGTERPARQQTDVYLGCDDRNLYLGVVCWEAQMAALMVEHKAGPESRDRNVYQDDSVEVFVQPPGSPPWHFAVNALGAMLDSRGWTAERDDVRLNLDWQAATSRRSNRWILEMTIPFSSLAAEGPYADEEWRINVCRNERPFAETSTWAPLSRAVFHLPEEFGRLVIPDLPVRPPAPVPDPDLIGHWDFETVKGNWTPDASGHGHAGLMTVPMRQAEGKIGQALEFTGAGFVDIAPTPDLNLGEAMTLAAWVQPRAVGSMRIIDKGPAGGSDGYMLDTHPANNIRVVTRPVGLMLSDTLPVNEWSHLAVTLGGGTLRVYLNGRQIAERADVRAPLTPTELPLRLGADSEGWNRFVGLMDDVRVYRRALSADEIARVREGKG